MIIGNKSLVELFCDRYLRPGMSVLDVGSSGEAAALFAERGCQVSALSYGNIPNGKYKIIKENLLYFQSDIKYDAIWCSHVLEHIPNINLFLRKLFSCGNKDCYFGVVVPPIKTDLVGGHINLFTPGTLCYNIVLAKQNISQATCIQHHNNIAVLWQKNDISLPVIRYDKGDLEQLSAYFPKPVFQGISGAKNWNIRIPDFSEKFAFEIEFHELINGNEEQISDRFCDTDAAWRRYHIAIEHVIKNGLRNGLDFGPGACPGLLIAKLKGIQMSGIDVERCKNNTIQNKFNTIQAKAKSMNYDMVFHDTDIYPWPYNDNQFDFVLCYDSLFVDWKEGIDWKTKPEMAKPRISELCRIVKPHGRFYIGGGGPLGDDSKVIRTLVEQNPKKIRFFDWTPRNIQEFQIPD